MNSVERYDSQTNQWTSDVSPTSSCRTSVGVGVLDGHLYSVGGQDGEPTFFGFRFYRHNVVNYFAKGTCCLNYVERYDPQSNVWQRVASMGTKRLGVSVAVLGGYLYAIGGSDGLLPLNTVERYDPKTNRWTPAQPMITRRKHLGSAVYKNFIYVVGGRDDLTELSSAERYNPQTNQWTNVIVRRDRYL